MRLKIGLREGFSILRTLLRLSNKSFTSLIIKVVKGFRKTSELKDFLQFLFGREESYLGVIINYKRRVKHALYLLIADGEVREVGSVDLESVRQRAALEELHDKLGGKGRVSQVMSYNKGGRLLFHQN